MLNQYKPETASQRGQPQKIILLYNADSLKEDLAVAHEKLPFVLES